MKGRKYVKDSGLTYEQSINLSRFMTCYYEKQEEVLYRMATAPRENGRITETPELQRSLINLSTFVENEFDYVNDGYCGEKYYEDLDMKEKFLSAISKLSRRDQVAWLIRLQDYIEEAANKEEPK